MATKAKVFLTSGATDYIVANTDDLVYGSTGTETITMASNANGITVDSNVETVAFINALSTYTFLQVGNVLKVYESDGTTLRASVAIDDDGSTLLFNGVSYAVAMVAGTPATMTLGGTTVSAEAAAAVVVTVTGTAAALAADSAALVATDANVILTDTSLDDTGLTNLAAINAKTSGLVNATTVLTMSGTAAHVKAITDAEGSSGNKIDLKADVAVTLSDTGSVAAAVLSAIGGATSGTVTGSSISTVTGSSTEVTAAMVTEATAVTVAANAAVTLSDTGSVAAAVLSAIGGATSGTVTGSSISTVTGSSTEVTAAMVTEATKVTVAADATVALSDNSLTYIDATDLSAIGGATTGIVTVANPIVITGAIADVTAALVTEETLVVSESALVTISSGLAETNLNATAINAIDAKATGTLTINLSDAILSTTLNSVTFNNTTNDTEINLANVASNAITLVDATVASGGRLIIDGQALTGTNALNFDGHVETNGQLLVWGGAASDTIIGGQGGNTIAGGGGADIITGGTGVDLISFSSMNEDSGTVAQTGSTVGTAVTYTEGSVGETINEWTSGQDKIYFSSSDTANAAGTEVDTLKSIGKGGVVANTDRYVHVTDTVVSDSVDTGAGAVTILNTLDTSAVTVGDSFIVAMDNDTDIYLYRVKQISDSDTITQQDVTLIGVINDITTIANGDFVSN